MTAVPGKPTIDQVALLIRARTKDDSGNEVGTFDDATRPTDVQCVAEIDAAYDVIRMRLPTDLSGLSADVMAGMVQVVALEAACRIEKAYWPEQVRTDRSNYSVLKVERDEELAALVQMATAPATEEIARDMANLPILSWTSLTWREPPGSPTTNPQEVPLA